MTEDELKALRQKLGVPNYSLVEPPYVFDDRTWWDVWTLKHPRAESFIVGAVSFLVMLVAFSPMLFHVWAGISGLADGSSEPGN